jgi:hypothetical protein
MLQLSLILPILRSLFWRASTSTIAQLEASLDMYELLAWVSGAVVLVGVIAEVASDRASFRNASTKRAWKFWGEMLLIVGLVGEVLFGIATSVISGSIIAKMGLEAAQLQSALADRNLSQDQQIGIAKACMRWSGQTVFIRSYPNDHEAARLIVEIRRALELAHVRAEDRTGELTATWTSAGLVLGIHIDPGEGERLMAETLVKALRGSGRLSVEELSEMGSSSSVTDISVGVKPTPPMGSSSEVAKGSPLPLPQRSLTQEQQNDIRDKLKALAGTPINLLRYPGDPEIDGIADQITAALVAAHWNVSASVGTENDRSTTGIRVNWVAGSGDIVKARYAADCALTKALNDNELGASGCGQGFQGKDVLVSGRANPEAMVKIVIGKQR